MPPGLEDLAFLAGTWRGSGEGHYPTMSPFRFDEEVRFWHVGAPILQYAQWAWSPVDGEPLHLETGVWRPVGDGRVAVTVSLPRVAEVSEGLVDGRTVELRSIAMPRTEGGARLLRADRTYVLLTGDVLVYDLVMAIEGVDMTHHVHSELSRVDADGRGPAGAGGGAPGR